MRALAIAVLSSVALCGAAAQQPSSVARARPRTVIAIIEGDTILALTRAVRPSLEVTRPRTVPGDLTSVRVFDAPRHLTFRVYYDTVSESVARSSINLLDDIYAELARITGAAPGKVEWSAVAFVATTSYEPPRIGNEVRWSIVVDPDGTLGTRGERDLFQMLPHEQVHAVQSSLSLALPRWFSEGQAEWAGLHVTEQWRPTLAATRRSDTASPTFGSHRLGAWGAVSVSTEAVLRQMTPEQREHHARDSTWLPPGPYKFGPTDLVSDESDTQARYGAASALFAELEAAKGAPALQSWFATLWREPAKWTTPALVESMRKTLGVDVEPKLR